MAIGGLAALAGALLGGGRGASRGALGGGLMAILGSLAYSALQARAQSGASAAVPPPVGLYEPSTPAEEQALDEAAAIVVQAMINAAKADGQVDATERARILGRLVEDGADAEAQAYVEAELSKPLATAALVEAVAGRPDLAIQVYGASLLAIDIDTPAETDYLRSLANALQLDAATVASLHEAFGVH
ncbi:tellurite resistance TerB family protein [Defluviicoccus vanus]|uniref:tellurite resistance TerB family protein n=1 Tax=Defluviicoccus vanus TaxID=111831 RepID=UPI001CBA6337|nr:tellurite resistance TerB family protein [Defluviicoccus vanus]